MTEPTKATAEWTDPDGDVWTFSEPMLTTATAALRRGGGYQYDLTSFANDDPRDAALRAAFLSWHRAAYILQPDECYPPGELPRKMAENEVRHPDGSVSRMIWWDNEVCIGGSFRWTPSMVVLDYGTHPTKVPGQLARLQAFWDKHTASTTPKDELPEDVFLIGGSRRWLTIEAGGVHVWFNSILGGRNSYTVTETQLREFARDADGDPLGWPRALAYYDEQVGKKTSSASAEMTVAVDRPAAGESSAGLAKSGGMTDGTPRQGVTAGETALPKPSYIPDSAPWCWVTDGLGRQVGAWFVNHAGTHKVCMRDPWSGFDHQWASLHIADELGVWSGHGRASHPARTPSAALQCRALYDRCVVDDEGRVWEMAPAPCGAKLTHGDEVRGVALGRGTDDGLRAYGFTAPDQIAKVRAFIENHGTEAKNCAAAPVPETRETSQADEQSSSVGINTTGECARCGKSHFRLGSFCSRECERLGPAKDARPMDEPEPPLPAGDGVTDDTAAIQALADKGKPIPTGTYRVTGPPSEPEPPFAGMVCAHCGKRPATCIGAYETSDCPILPACDDCCGHGCEDGHCDQIDDLRVSDEPDDQRTLAALLERDQLIRGLSKAKSERDTALAWVEQFKDCLTTIVDEAFGLQEVMDIDALFSCLERELASQRRSHRAALARAEKAEKQVASVDTSNEFLRERCANLRRDLTRPPLDALLATLSKALPTTPISPKNTREALELVVRERDEAKERAEKAEADSKRALQCADNTEDCLAKRMKERNEAQARVRELEAELEAAITEASKWNTTSLCENQRRQQAEKELASVTAQRDRAEAELAKSTGAGGKSAEIAQDAHLVDLERAIAGAINSCSAENGSNTPDFIIARMLASGLRAFDEAVNARIGWYGSKLEVPGQPNPRPSCIPDGVTEWTRLPSGLACWKAPPDNVSPYVLIDDKEPFEPGPFAVVKSDRYETAFHGKMGEHFRKVVSPADFHAARVFMGWEQANGAAKAVAYNG